LSDRYSSGLAGKLHWCGQKGFCINRGVLRFQVLGQLVAFVLSTKNAFYGRCPALDKLDNCSGVDRKGFDNLSTLDELDSVVLLNRQKFNINSLHKVLQKYYKIYLKDLGPKGIGIYGRFQLVR
jgi:hypothetical protein